MAPLACCGMQAGFSGVAGGVVSTMHHALDDLLGESQTWLDRQGRVVAASAVRLVMTLRTQIKATFGIAFVGADKVGRVLVVTERLNRKPTQVGVALFAVHRIVLTFVVVTR